MAVSWPLARLCRGQGRPCRSARLPYRSAHPRAPTRRAARPFTPARACAQRPSASPSYCGRGPRPCRRAQRRVAARPWPYRGPEREPGLRPACPAPQYNIFVLQPKNQPNQAPQSRYNFLYRDTAFPANSLQYKYPITIQSFPCPMSQYSTSIATQPTANLLS